MKTKLSQRAQQLIARTTSDQTYLRALLVFAAQNPGFESGNYDSAASYNGDARPVQKQLREIRDLAWRYPSLSNEVLKEASRAFSGRLQFVEREEKFHESGCAGGVAVDYTTGQYWPTEYRLAALTVIKTALSDVDRQFERGEKAVAA